MTTTTDGTRTIGGTNWAQDGMSAIWTSPAVTGRERDLLRASVWTSGGTVALQLQIGRRDIDDDEPDDDLLYRETVRLGEADIRALAGICAMVLARISGDPR